MWFFNWAIPIFSLIVIALAVMDSVRRRRLTWGFLFLTNSMLVYWMETIGDWGQHLIFSPKFARHTLLDWLPIKGPNNPIFMPFAYATYWTVHALIVLWLANYCVKRYGWSLLKGCLVLSFPVNYGWNLLVEGFVMTRLGWETYDPGFGPHITWANGAQWTLVWTVGLMCVWPNVIAYWAGKPPVRGLNHIERFCGLARFTRPRTSASGPVGSGGSLSGTGASAATVVKSAPLVREAEYDSFLNYEVTIPRWRFEVARFGAWCLVFQVSFFMMLIVPLVLMRVITGHDSIYAP
ncbi:hypothetical protein BHQ19_30090 [Mycolicibacterium porcinum]|nr:hypothetical protein BHQ19_30090 [Mycolicibacterium porcinum]TDH46937.1 hypothetical protein E2F47_26905 [Mycobacterium eburneum]